MKHSIHSKLGPAVVFMAVAAGLVVPAAQAAEPDAIDRALLRAQSVGVVVDDPADRALFNTSGIRATHRVAPIVADAADRAMFASARSRTGLHAGPTADDPADRALFNRLGLPTSATSPTTLAGPQPRPGSGVLAAPVAGEVRGFEIAWSSVGLGAAMGIALAVLAGAALLVVGRTRVTDGHPG
jgi:hypothetical protein